MKGYRVKTNNGGRKSDNSSQTTNGETKDKNRQKVIMRARRDIRRYVNANYVHGKSSFITFTFNRHVTDLTVANLEFKNFILRLKRYLKNEPVKYLCVPEFMKKKAKGRVHYHVAFFNIPYIPQKKLLEIWDNGFVYINQIKHVDNVGAYICKYLSKESERLKGRKCYFKSKNLDKPVMVEDKKKIEQMQLELSSKKPCFETVYDNEYTGKVKYTQYRL